jgi:hypothetical protein
VDDKVKESWEKQGYKPVAEYHSEAREGLTYEDILKHQ